MPDATFINWSICAARWCRLCRACLAAEQRRDFDDRPEDGDTDSFLDRLITFMEDKAYRANGADFEGLFRDLGVRDDSFDQLRERAAGLTGRPFCRLHADLHPKNLIIDHRGRLWVIDWELAIVGRPPLRLVAHLYLMRYPAGRRERMVQDWCRVVERVAPEVHAAGKSICLGFSTSRGHSRSSPTLSANPIKCPCSPTSAGSVWSGRLRSCTGSRLCLLSR
ncbi:phosphotransferase family protein [Streptomyces sp. NPDC048419]|uniref:phosphotransferase family protein n=1 Tax=Streptomyces sp. NPDC048419 TaxID=3365547 RepID=UPI00372122B9